MQEAVRTGLGVERRGAQEGRFGQAGLVQCQGLLERCCLFSVYRVEAKTGCGGSASTDAAVHGAQSAALTGGVSILLPCSPYLTVIQSQTGFTAAAG